MKTSPLDDTDLGRSVISVPPLARTARLELDRGQNARLLAHLRAGGVRTFLYGGNANLYNQSVGEYPALLDMLEEISEPGDWIIPSIGPDYGKLMDQAAILRERRFPTAMVLPLAFPATAAGTATALRHASDRAGRPLILYLKSEAFLSPTVVASLVADGVLAAVKYAVPREDTSRDAYLPALTDALGGTRRVASGFGERPALIHMRTFGLAGYTSGLVCIAPALSQAMLEAAKAGDWARAEALRSRFLPMEDLRDRINAIRVLHDAVTLSGIADMGPMLPALSGLDEADRPAAATGAAALLELETAQRKGALAA